MGGKDLGSDRVLIDINECSVTVNDISVLVIELLGLVTQSQRNDPSYKKT
jgi:hypothetical protein